MNGRQFFISRLWFGCLLTSAAALLSLAHAGESVLTPTDYRDLASACPTRDVQSRFIARGDSGKYRFHAIELAAGDAVNHDLYEIEIQKFPVIDGKPGTPKSVFDRFRMRLREMLDPSISRFVAAGPEDEKRWTSKDPVGSLMLFEINVISPLSLNPKVPKLHSELGAVVLTQIGGNDTTGYWWRFATVNTPQAGDHPVSGTREFGIRKSMGAWVLYTRGLDRATGWMDTINAESFVFAGADSLWRSMQTRSAKDIESLGGSATIRAPASKRIDWQKEFVERKLFDRCNWSAGSLGTRLEPRDVRSALALAIERDQTGSAAVLTVAALRAGSDDIPKVVRDIASASKQLREAATPAEIDEIVSSELGHRLGLSYTRSAYDPTRLGYVDLRRDRGGQRHLIGAVIDSPLGVVGTHNITQELLSRNALPMPESQLRAVFQAVTLVSDGATIESFLGTIVDEKGRGTMKEVMTVLSEVPTTARDPKLAMERAKTALLKEGGARLNERFPLVKNTIDNFHASARSFNTPGFRDLQRGNLTADSFMAGGNALRSVASLFGDDATARDIDNAMRFVSAGMDVYKGVGLLAAGFSGGTFIAATSILSGVGGLNAFSGGGGDGAEIARAIGQLTALINRQFVQVNWKLDDIRVTLGNIERRLVRLEGLAAATLSEVRATHELVTGLYYRIDRLEVKLLNELGRSALDDCWNQITYPRAELKHFGVNQWQGCLRAFSRMALLPVAATQPVTGDSQRWKQLTDLLRSQDVNDRATLWRYAAVIAENDAFILGDNSLKELAAYELRTNYLAGAHSATEAAVGFSALIKRRGRDRIRPDELTIYVRNNRVDEMVAQLEAVAAFQKSLAGPDPSARLARLVDFYASYHQPYLEALGRARVEAIRDIVAPRLNADNLAYEGSISNCETGDALGTIPGNFKKELPAIAHTHAGFFHVKAPSGTLEKRPVLKPLTVCRTPIVLERTGITIGSIGEHYILKSSTTYSVRLFDKIVIDQVTIEKTGFSLGFIDPEVEQLQLADLYRQIADALIRKSNEPDWAESMKEMQVGLISDQTVPEVGLRVLAAMTTQMVKPATQTDLRKYGEPIDGTLALLRGHLALAFPMTYLSHDRLRAVLEGGVETRAGDVATLVETLDCAVVLQDQLLDAVPRTYDGSAYPSKLQIETSCGKDVTVPLFTPESSKSFASTFVKNVDEIKKIFTETDWTTEEAYRSDTASVAAGQLKAFMADGNKDWFYPKYSR